MIVYLDSSALVKRVLREDESGELIRYVAGATADELATSVLALVEVSRSLRSRLDFESPTELAESAEVAVSGLVEVPISPAVLSLARRIGPPRLRSLDAIHLATAATVDADIVIAYDDRLLEAAHELGFRTFSPGR